MSGQDLDLKHAVELALEDAPDLDAAHIGVTAESGVITLTGRVVTHAEKRAAEEAVRAIPGVRAIAEEIEVRPTGANTATDEEIARHALETLHWNTAVPHEDLRLTVEGGCIILSGTVEAGWQREAAEHALARLAGVTGIVNRIALRPPPPPANLDERIGRAVARAAGSRAAAVTVATEGGRVTLAGSVPDAAARHAALRAAWAAPGVSEVEDRLTVEPAR
jgi:osmotically-inducible protein OsmY